LLFFACSLSHAPIPQTLHTAKKQKDIILFFIIKPRLSNNEIRRSFSFFLSNFLFSPTRIFFFAKKEKKINFVYKST
jgi:hypothetical protein